MPQRFLAAIPFVLGAVICAPPAADAARAKGGACAAFAGDGTSATATYDEKKVSLEITYTPGSTSHLTAVLLHPLPQQPLFEEELAPEVCRIFFDTTADLIAIGISPDSEAGAFLEVLVADVKSSSWVGHFDVKPQISLDSPALWGFLEGNSSMVITKQVEKAKSFTDGPVYGSFLFAPSGEILARAAMTTWRILERTSWNTFYADASHTRLWLLPCTAYSARFSQQPFCPISSTSLTGQNTVTVFNPAGRVSNRQEAWWVPQAAVPLDSDRILIGEAVARIDTIWRVDMRQQTMERLVVPRHAHFPNSDWSQSATLSPDGQIAAVSFDQNTGNFPWITEGAHWSGKHIVFVRLQPLELITIFPSGSAERISAFAVDHRTDKIILLAFRDKRWQRYEFSDQPRPH